MTQDERTVLLAEYAAINAKLEQMDADYQADREQRDAAEAKRIQTAMRRNATREA
jgi:hypothetical protein